MGLFSKNKKKTDNQVDYEHEQDETNVDLNKSDLTENDQNKQSEEQELDDKMLKKQSFLRGKWNDYDLHNYFIIDTKEEYEDILKDMRRDNLKDTDIPYQLYELHKPSEEDITRFRNGLYFFQFTMKYEQTTKIPIELDDEFKTTLLAVLYAEIFEAEPLLKDFILEASVYSGEDLIPHEDGQIEQMEIYPTLNIIFKPGVKDNPIIQSISELYNQLMIYGFVITAETDFSPEMKKIDEEWAEFDAMMDQVSGDKEAPVFNNDKSEDERRPVKDDEPLEHIEEDKH